MLDEKEKEKKKKKKRSFYAKIMLKELGLHFCLTYPKKKKML
jgi:hypothetical protein